MLQGMAVIDKFEAQVSDLSRRCHAFMQPDKEWLGDLSAKRDGWDPGALLLEVSSAETELQEHRL